MTFSTTYNYNNGSNFTYDSTKISVTSKAQLALIPLTGQTFTPNIPSASYNASLISLSGNTLSQVDQRPAGSVIYYGWDTQLNASWGTPATVTSNNSAAISGGVLDLTGSTNKWVTFSGANTPTQTGTIAFTVVPNYSGTPSAEQAFYMGFGSTQSNNGTYIYHNTDSNLHLTVKSSTGTNIAAISTSWSPVSGTSYTFVAQIDVTNGATKLFINGVQFSTTQTGTGTRTTGVTVNTGKDTDSTTGNANFKISGLAIYNTVVSPTGATPLSDTIYPSATATLPLFTYGGVGNVQAFTAFAETDSGTPGYTLNAKYWNGSSWVASNGSFAQSSSAATVAANIGSLPAANTLQANIIFNAQNSQQTSDGMTVTYTGQIYPQTNPSIVPNSPITMDSMFSFAASTDASGSDSVMFYLLINGTAMWWNGTAWATSNATLAQSNTAADINTNASTLPISLGATIFPYTLLHSATGATTPDINSLTITYNYFGVEPSGPNKCLLWGYLTDVQGNPVVGAKVQIINFTWYENQGIFISPQTLTSNATDSIGYFDISVEETTTVGTKYLFQIVFPTGTTSVLGQTLIPNTPQQNFASLTYTS